MLHPSADQGPSMSGWMPMASNPKRVLLVTPTQTHPPTQGNSARILAFGRELKRRGFAVEVLYFELDQWNPQIHEAMRHEWDELHVLPGRPHKEQSFAAFWGLDDWCPDALTTKVRGLCRARRYSAVIVNYVWLSKCLEGVEDSAKIIDTHDLFGGRAEVALRSGLEPSWYFTSEALEAQGLDRADAVLAIQAEEHDLLAARTRARVMTVGHPVHASFRPAPDTSKGETFGYFGSGNPWNLASVKALDGALAQQAPELDWLLAGSICRRPLGLRSSPRVLGLVDEPADFYDLVSCVLNPMLAGTGLKIKTVEALAHGRPVIGTAEAFRGLEIHHRLQDLQTIEEMIGAIKDFSASQALRQDLSAASARSYVAYMAQTQKAYDDFARLIG